MTGPYTMLVRRSQLQYVGICLELNLAACGDTLPEVEKHLSEAIQAYLADVAEHPETVVAATPMMELIEFLQDTQPQGCAAPKKCMLRPFEVHEVPAYA